MFFKSAPRFWEKVSFSQSPIQALLGCTISVLLLPLSWIYGLIVWLKQSMIDSGIPTLFKIHQPATVPIIIVGNIRVGGTGKTPVVIALANELVRLGFKPGVISRGYRLNSQTKLSAPTAVGFDSKPMSVGDEPALMAKRINNHVPIWIYPKRKVCIDALLQSNPEVNVIISDDGLQHAALVRWPAREGGRDLELVIEDERGVGNGRLLPAGPLRESANRERDATIIITDELIGKQILSNPKKFNLKPVIDSAYPLNRPQEAISFTQMLTKLVGLKIGALAAIGNPEKFFRALTKLGVHLEQSLGLADHAPILQSDLERLKTDVILITEKDAVKCSEIEDARIWVIPMELSLPLDFTQWVREVITRPNPYTK